MFFPQTSVLHTDYATTVRQHPYLTRVSSFTATPVNRRVLTRAVVRGEGVIES